MLVGACYLAWVRGREIRIILVCTGSVASAAGHGLALVLLFRTANRYHTRGVMYELRRNLDYGVCITVDI